MANTNSLFTEVALTPTELEQVAEKLSDPLLVKYLKALGTNLMLELAEVMDKSELGATDAAIQYAIVSSTQKGRITAIEHLLELTNLAQPKEQ